MLRFLLKNNEMSLSLIYGLYLSILFQSVYNLPGFKDLPVSEKVQDNFAKFYCYKLKPCTPGGEGVCGYDEYTGALEEFDDLCALYKANCHRIGMFKATDKIVCQTKKEFSEKFKNMSLTFEHVNMTFTAFTDTTTRKPIYYSPTPTYARPTYVPPYTPSDDEDHTETTFPYLFIDTPTTEFKYTLPDIEPDKMTVWQKISPQKVKLIKKFVKRLFDLNLN